MRDAADICDQKQDAYAAMSKGPEDEWSFEANLARGHLPSGEALEALYGTGWWTQIADTEPRVTQCPICGGHAYDLGDQLDCENCGVFSLCANGEG